MKILLTTAALFAMAASAAAEDLPFVGKWDCEGHVMSFANDVYDNGTEQRQITEAQEGSDGSYAVFTDDETYVTVSDFTPDSMLWTASDDSGLQLKCERLFTE